MSSRPKTLRSVSLLALLFVSLTLAGCGGGGGGGEPGGHSDSRLGSLAVSNSTGFSGNFVIAGKSFRMEGYDTIGLQGLEAGKSYGWTFLADGGWTRRSGTKYISTTSSSRLSFK